MCLYQENRAPIRNIQSQANDGRIPPVAVAFFCSPLSSTAFVVINKEYDSSYLLCLIISVAGNVQTFLYLGTWHLPHFALSGTPAHTRRHTFRDHLVPLAALEGVIDCQTVRGICYHIRPALTLLTGTLLYMHTALTLPCALTSLNQCTNICLPLSHSWFHRMSSYLHPP